MSTAPLVTVVCLCYNHERFVKEAIFSVVRQTYRNIQIIVVDDASTDESVREIRSILPADVLFISLKENLGNCKAFNKALRYANGKYIIDFATDDLMISQRIEKQVQFFESLSDEYGIVFSDSTYVDEDGKFLRHHSQYLIEKKLINNVPQGDVFADVLRRYFISTPSMMIRTEVLRILNGYDEDLVYEDFDLWVRASRNYKFAYQDESLTKVRKSTRSMSAGWYTKGDPQLLSTYKVCRKAQQMIHSEEEKIALIYRLRYELRQTVFSENRQEADLFFTLLKESTTLSMADKLLFQLNRLNLPLAFLRNFYQQLKYK